MAEARDNWKGKWQEQTIIEIQALSMIMTELPLNPAGKVAGDLQCQLCGSSRNPIDTKLLETTCSETSPDRHQILEAILQALFSLLWHELHSNPTPHFILVWAPNIWVLKSNFLGSNCPFFQVGKMGTGLNFPGSSCPCSSITRN